MPGFAQVCSKGVTKQYLCFCVVTGKFVLVHKRGTVAVHSKPRSVDACGGGDYSEASGRREHENGLAVTDP